MGEPKLFRQLVHCFLLSGLMHIGPTGEIVHRLFPEAPRQHGIGKRMSRRGELRGSTHAGLSVYTAHKLDEDTAEGMQGGCAKWASSDRLNPTA